LWENRPNQYLPRIIVVPSIIPVAKIFFYQTNPKRKIQIFNDINANINLAASLCLSKRTQNEPTAGFELPRLRLGVRRQRRRFPSGHICPVRPIRPITLLTCDSRSIGGLSASRYQTDIKPNPTGKMNDILKYLTQQGTRKTPPAPALCRPLPGIARYCHRSYKGDLSNLQRLKIYEIIGQIRKNHLPNHANIRAKTTRILNENTAKPFELLALVLHHITHA
jgi:hypothetical protein